MADTRNIICGCGKHLGFTTSSTGGGVKVCPNCGATSRYDVNPQTGVRVSLLKEGPKRDERS